MSLESAPVQEALPNGNASAVQGDRRSATIRYSDRIDVAETFVDSITSLLVDAQSMRIEFCVTRLDEMKINSPVTGRRYPACRIVLSPSAAVDLMSRLRRVAATFEQRSKAMSQPETEPAKPADNGSAG